MSFSGTLDDFSPVEIISVLDILQKSGKLRLTRGEDQGMVVFRRGRIIYAASSGFRENLGTMLLARGLVDELQLVEALGLQVAANEEKRLGNILIEMGALSQEDLNKVVLEQVIQVVSQFGDWDSGEFDFSRVQIADHGEVELQSGDLWAPLGLSPNQILLRLTQLTDEAQRERPAPEISPSEVASPASIEPPVAELREIDVEVPEVEPEASNAEPVEPSESASLSDFVGELRGPQVKGELLQRVLEQARRVFERCVLFSVRHDGFRTIAHIGRNLPRPAEGSRLLEISLPRTVPSILSRCAATGQPTAAQLPQDEGDNRLLAALGGASAEKSVAIPLAVRGETVLILYGDDLAAEPPAGWAENLRGFLAETGRQIEADIQAEIAAEIAAAQSA